MSTKTKKIVVNKYHVEFCVCDRQNPHWIEFDTITQKDIVKKLSEDYDYFITRDIIENILLGRHKKKMYPYLIISKI